LGRGIRAMSREDGIGEVVGKDRGKVTDDDFINALCLGFIFACFLMGLAH
jgi:hypothetical protein